MKSICKDNTLRQITFVLFMSGLWAASAWGQARDINYYIDRCPFKMPLVVEPVFASRTFVITDYGAEGDGQKLNTQAFAQAIKECSRAGGGTVIVPPGLWLTGPIELCSNINLHLEQGAVILFTPDHTQYPMIQLSGPNSTPVTASPIYGYKLKNIAITGQGILDGAGHSWRPVKKEKTTKDQWKDLVATGGVVSKDGKIWWPSAEAMNGSEYLNKLKKTHPKHAPEVYQQARDFLRPHMVSLINCENILVEGVTLRNSPKFVFIPYNCKNITIRYANIYNDWWAQNGDGIDISACQSVIIYGCTINVGDDAICMKSSGRLSTGPRLKDIIIAGCTVYHGHGGFVIGSGTSGGMQNIFVSDCSFLGTDIGIRVKTGIDRGGLVKDIFMNGIYMADIKGAAILFNPFYASKLVGTKEEPTKTSAVLDKFPVFCDFHFDNIYCRRAEKAMILTGLSQSPLKKLFFNKVTILAEHGCEISDAQELHFKDCNIQAHSDAVSGK